jgi:hypothetical protein
VIQQREGFSEGGDAGGIGQPNFVAIQGFPVEEERLPEVLRGPEVRTAGADPVTRGEGGVRLLDEPQPECRPRPVPAVPVAAGDLRCDRETLTDVGHAGVGLADAALQLPVEVLVIEEQLHGFAP